MAYYITNDSTMIKKLNFIAFLSLIFIGFVACSDSGTSPEVVEEQEYPALESINFETEIGTERTNVIDAELASNGVVILGAYKDLNSSCLGMKLFLLKVSFDGEELWKRKYSDIHVSKCDELDLVTTDADEVVIFAAARDAENISKFDYHVYKFTTAGDLMWEQTIDYSDYDIFISGTHKANGEIVAYPYEFGSDTFRKVTLDTNGNILEDIESPSFTYNHFNIIHTPSRKKIYTSPNDGGTDLKVYDRNLQLLSELNIPLAVSYLNEAQGSENGYFAYSGDLLKLDSNFETEWSYTPEYSHSHISPASIAEHKYAIIEERSFSPGSYTAYVISVIGTGGQILSRNIIEHNGNYPTVRKVLSRGNNDAIVVYHLGLNAGINIYQQQ